MTVNTAKRRMLDGKPAIGAEVNLGSALSAELISPLGFDFVLVDGPTAHLPTNCFNRLGVLNWLPQIMQEEFVIIADDSARAGESLLVSLIMYTFANRGIAIQKKEIIGAASQTIIATSKLAKYLFL